MCSIRVVLGHIFGNGLAYFLFHCVKSSLPSEFCSREIFGKGSMRIAAGIVPQHLRYFILFLSVGVLERPYCQMEIRHALALKKPVVLLHGERGFSPDPPKRLR